jgi:hypothetical protein
MYAWVSVGPLYISKSGWLRSSSTPGGEPTLPYSIPSALALSRTCALSLAEKIAWRASCEARGHEKQKAPDVGAPAGISNNMPS